MKSSSIGLVVIVAALVGVMLVPRLLNGGGVAPTPAYFDTSLSLDDVLERAEASGKPVLALVTADWCPPCQKLKRGTLVDERVAAFITSSTEPAYITDKQGYDVERLGVKAFPTSVILRDGEIVASLRGAVSARRYLKWLNENAGVAQANAEP